MPHPYLATRDSEPTGEVWNLQLHFWRCACEHFDKIAKYRETEDCTYIVFGVDAAIVLVLGGTSISQLLGQQWRGTGDDVPHPQCILRDNVITNAQKRGVAVPDRIHERYVDFLKNVYHQLRHFGTPKHQALYGITPAALCGHMTFLQELWRFIAYAMDDTEYPDERGDYRFLPKFQEFTRTFELPDHAPAG